MSLSEQLMRKYTEVFDSSEWEIETDTGWQPLIDTKKTIEYQVYELCLDNGMFLRCADNHIVFLQDLQEIFVKDLVTGQQIITANGLSSVSCVKNLGHQESMYDVGVNSDTHRFYSNGILSHNSTIAAAYLLWYAMFTPDSLVLIASNKHDGALEIMQRIRFAYENIPDHIRAGAISYNKKSVEFDNGSRIIAQTTTENTGRGLSISCLSSNNTFVTVLDQETNLITQESLMSVKTKIEQDVPLLVLTKEGYKNFEYVTLVERETFSVTLQDGSYVECTDDHLFYSMTHAKWIEYKNIGIGDKIETFGGFSTVTHLSHIGTQMVSDLVNVADTKSFIANNINVHNCIYLDEFAFVRPGIADDLWKSLSPTLATGGKCIITSTPNTDEDRFAKIWFEAIKTFDEYGNETKIGRNGFKSFKAIWSDHPERDAKWALEEELAIGTASFKQEHECLGADSVITLQDEFGNIFDFSIGDFFEQLRLPNRRLTNENKEFYTNFNYRVLTISGFSNFAGVSLMGIKSLWTIKTESEKSLECTKDHKLFVSLTEKLQLSDLKIGDSIITKDGIEKIISIADTGKVEPVYDLIEVENGHRYYANSILSSNCEFVGSEETLIDAMILSNIKGIEPLFKTGNQVRWYKEIDPAMTYIVSLDPSIGTGGDNAAIQVLEIPSMTQIAEWQHNKTPVEGQIRTLQHICHELQKNGAEEIFWSVENNTLGEAALVVIRDTGEENIPGLMLNDPEMRKMKGIRKGFSTSNRKKLEACIKFKRLIERGRLTLKSKNIISELKVFIRSESSFKAKSGSTDDLVTSMLMAIRMVDLVSKWDSTLQDVINSNIGAVEDDDYEDDDDDYSGPMPVSFL